MHKTLTTVATVAALAAGASQAQAAADYRGRTAEGAPIRFEYHLGDVSLVKTKVPVTCRHEISYDVDDNPLPGSDRTRTTIHPVQIDGRFRVGRTRTAEAPGELLGQSVRASYSVTPRGLRFATIGGTVAVTSSLFMRATEGGHPDADFERWTCTGSTTFEATTRTTPRMPRASAAVARELHTDAEGATLSARCRTSVAKTLPLEDVLRRGLPVRVACDGPADRVGATLSFPEGSAASDAWERMHNHHDPELSSFEPPRIGRAGAVTVRVRLYDGRLHALLRRYPRTRLSVVGRQQDALEPLLFHTIGQHGTTLVR